VTLFHLFFIFHLDYFSLLGALIIVRGGDGAKRRHIMSGDRKFLLNSKSGGRFKMGLVCRLFAFFFPFFPLFLSPKHRSCSFILVGMLYKTFLIGLQVPAFFALSSLLLHKILLLCPFPFSGGVIYRFSNSWFLVFSLVSHLFFVYLLLRFLPCSSKRSSSSIFCFVYLTTFRQEGSTI